ncbi:hypothetical protein AVEN_214790-1 [Araneus ventricosus]|uniref:Uncharacterized protein n=1 Tax=Araneus ventricosus TaxID=182803 RepID=A0A4Y2RIY9_ARAVE|nr:hypothetical protein AVEN_214790-1 [Araneus ventricosus]
MPSRKRTFSEAFDDDEDILLGASTQEFLEYDDDYFRDISPSAENPIQDMESKPLDADVYSDTSQLLPDDSSLLYNQEGSGFEDQLVSSSGRTDIVDQSGSLSDAADIMEGYVPESVDEAIAIRERSRRFNQRYQAEEIIFEAGVIQEKLPENIRRKPFPSIWDIVRQLFQI